MIPVADRHFPRLFAAHDEASRPAPPRAVLRGIGKALGMIYQPADHHLPDSLATLVERLPHQAARAESGAGED